MTTAVLAIEVRHAARVCYAMHQNAVPWLHRIAVRNDGPAELRDLEVAIDLAPGSLASQIQRIAAIPPGATVECASLDPHLDVGALADLEESQRAQLRVVVRDAAGELAATTAAIEVLAYNEWPGLEVLPELLAAFVQPNHPALGPVLRDASARLERATGGGALDGYRETDPQRVRHLLAALYDALRALDIGYALPAPGFGRSGQKVRTAEQVLGDRLATCLDLALLFAGLLEHAGLRPLVVLQQDHAFVGAWSGPGSVPEPWLGPAVELRKHAALGAIEFIDCTLACGPGGRPFDAAASSAAQLLADDARFVGALDVAAARRRRIRPLPARAQAFVAVPDAPAEPLERPAPVSRSPGPDVAAGDPVANESPRGPSPVKDRLEHWRNRLLDLSLWNRLLNFVDTKKAVPLCAHDPAALLARLQGGSRLRIHPRPEFGGPGDDSRDLELERRRTGVDPIVGFLADELAAGRVRAELDGDELDARLVEVFRHARTSLEESGANTLHLAVGFLEWFESPQAQRPRRAPLLLLPLIVERASVREGFRVALDDAEPRLNQSLLLMLLRDHGIDVGLDDAPPEDEQGIDLGRLFDAFRRAVLAMPRWEVRPTASIGFFSFTKYLMWLDLAQRDELLRSAPLRHLVAMPGAPLPQEVSEVPRERLDETDPAAVFCPKDADSSQLAAVLAGAAGRTFVLEGPPGTGKSQTITNLIAQALANRKRVLFVAEKRAALEVVQRRLDEVGLGPFCLELHSSKSGPKAVLAQLRRALDVGARREPGDWLRIAAALQHERQALNGFVRALHRPREHGISVFAAMAELVALGAGQRVPLSDLDCTDPVQVAGAATAVAELAAAAASLGVPAREPWWGVRLVDWTPALGREVPALAGRLAAAASAMAAASARVAAAFGLDAVFGVTGPSARQLDALRALAARFAEPALPPGALATAEWRAARASLTELVATGTARQRGWRELALRWRPELLALDLDRLLAAQRAASSSLFLVRWWRERAVRRQVAAAALGSRPPAAGILLADLESASAVRDADRRVSASPAAVLLGATFRGEATDWATVAGFVAWVDDVRRLLLQLEPGALEPSPRLLAAVGTCLDAAANGSTSLRQAIAALQTARDELDAAARAVGERLRLDADAAFGIDTDAGWLARIEARTQAWLGAVPRLRDQCAYERAAQAAVAAHAAPLVAAHRDGAVRTADLAATFRRTFLEAWLDTVHNVEPALARFRGHDHEVAIARFVESDQRAIGLAAEVVLARLAAEVPQVRDTKVANSELGILEREIKKQRRHKPVRRLLAEIPGLFARLSPCVLMSPLSVAQYLGRAGTRFDIVVFDEASQIPVWDAVGAIGRGESLVVVGDSRQLPPTTFFQRLSQGDEPTPDELPEDLESVLDECIAAGLPRAHLDWHYRSRHESLIAFSNRHYYDGRLLTFPAPQRAAPALGVRFVRVAGVYDRAGSQQNRIEAEALVAEVVGRLRDPARAPRSIGIVTFSQAQQVLIEDLLDRARGEHPEIEPWFTAAAEPVFVKNLENVQGDERDTILFSICYGPDAAGRIHENYGPLNQQGGERRLNVAITRARAELVVFASLRADQVATRTPALGARHLRAFLDYAERGETALVETAGRDPSAGAESPFEAAVADALRRRGHEVHTQVGCSGYRIDLAVVDPRAPGSYLLGIECDGAAYHAAATARDRDRLRAAVLRRLGWRLHRIWSTDYWLDPQGEIERAEAAIAAAAAGAAPTPAAPIEAPEVAIPAPTTMPSAPAAHDPDGPRDYVAVPAPEAGVPQRVLAVEGPIVFERLARIVATAWGIERLTDRARDRVRAALPPDAVEIDGVCWADRAQTAAFRGFRVPPRGAAARAADELPPVEVGNALLWCLRQHEALPADELVREAARAFGLQRVGGLVRGAMERALHDLVQRGRCRPDGEIVRSV